MNEKPNMPRNIPASVRQRLLNISRQEKRDFHEVLTRFALERLLYRLGQTIYFDQFILKGALLFVLWTDEIHRSTQDMDLLGIGEPSLERLEIIFRTACQTSVPPDGLVFLTESVAGRLIREDNNYQGVRLKMAALLDRAIVTLQIDIGFGDAVVPEPEETNFPSLLGFPAPLIRAYRRETSIAEKFLAIVTIGIDNSRMKDYFDIWLLSRDFAFEEALLSAAITATFARQRVPLPTKPPVGLTAQFSDNRAKITQWEAFVSQRVVTPKELLPFSGVVAQIAVFLLPVIESVEKEENSPRTWRPGGPWCETMR